MSKLIDSERLKAEIKRRLEVMNMYKDFYYPQIEEIEALLSFIETLPEESVSKDLEEAAKLIADEHGFVEKPSIKSKYTDRMVRDIFIEGIKAGAQLQKQQQENSKLVNKSIRWFNNIADDMLNLTTGNLSHKSASIRGRAIHAAEYLEKHKDDCLKENYPKIKGWIARDKDGELWLYHEKPTRYLSSWIRGGYIFFIDDLFPEISWESDPVEVELTIKKI